MDKHMMRLDKYLTATETLFRAQAKKAIANGQVKVDNEVIQNVNHKIDETVQEVLYMGTPVTYQKYVYYMLNKPAGYLSATRDKQQTVMDLIESKKKEELFPVGRLDKDTEGLLLITNNGDLAHNLLSPKKHVSKKYFARIQGKVTPEMIEVFQAGMFIGEYKALPADLTILTSNEVSEVEVVLYEGKFHQVKRMFHAVGLEVIYLKRLTMGKLRLDEELLPGQYRALTMEEIRMLHKGE